MTKDELKQILDKHIKWLRKNNGGKKANLYNVNLRGADLQGVHLQYANLYGANLRDVILRNAHLCNADLRGVNLRDANLQGADLQCINLRSANLCDANLRDVNLRGANLCGANLQDTDMWGADLRDVNLRNVNLRGANLENTKLPHFQIVPEEGEFIAWKCVFNNGSHLVAKVRVPADARRVCSLISRKIRVSKIEVLEGEGYSPTYGTKIHYKPGKIFEPHDFCDDIRLDCAPGIHLFISRREAEEWR